MAVANAFASSIPASGIRRMMHLASTTPGTIRLDIGDPDFATPDHVLEAADRAARAGATHYLPSGGLPQLRVALADKVERVNRVAASVPQVIVTQGATQAIFAALAITARPGDDILLPDPAWPNVRMMAAALGLTAIGYPLTSETSYLPHIEHLKELVSDRTRVLVLNSPSNPLGTVLDENLIAELVAVAAEHDLWIVSDECYDQMTFEPPGVSPAIMAPDRTICVYSLSKTYAMTGWRVGYAVVPTSLAETYARYQEASLACVNAPAQHAALAAVTGPQACLDAMRETYRTRRDVVVRAATETSISMPLPRGAIYAWLDIRACSTDAETFAQALLAEDGISVAPGTAFGDGGAGHIRVALTAAPEGLTTGLRAISRRMRRDGAVSPVPVRP